MMKLFTASLLLLGLTALVPAAGAADTEPRQEVQSAPEEKSTAVESTTDVNQSAESGKNGSESVTLDDLNGVRVEIDTLRQQWQRSLDTQVVQATRNVTLGGFVQGRYSVIGSGAQTTTNDTFEIPLFVLSLSGYLRRDYAEGRNISYFLSVSASTLPAANAGSTSPINLLDAYINYNLFQSLDMEKSFLTAAFGQQLKPFGLEPQASEEFKPTIRNSQSSGNLGLTPRDIGLVVRGDLFPHVDYSSNYRVPLLQYSFGVLNGQGPNNLDTNNDKDYVGRIALNAPVDYNHLLRGLSAGASYYSGRQNLTPPTGVTVPVVKGAKNRWEADLSYSNTPVGFTFEYVRGDDDQLSGSSAANLKKKLVKSEGYTATLFYNFGEQFIKDYKAQDRYDDWYPLTYQPFVRYDHWDPNIQATGNRTDIWTIGFNWFFAQTTKLQLNYNSKRIEVNGAKDRGDEFLTQFQFGW